MEATEIKTYETYKLQVNDDFPQRYIAILGESGYYKKRMEAFDLFRKMRPGKVIDIRSMVKKENVELFIKLACQFIESCRRKGSDDYCFSDDYSQFFRYTILPVKTKKSVTM